jgi:hypothetical protein
VPSGPRRGDRSSDNDQRLELRELITTGFTAQELEQFIRDELGDGYDYTLLDDIDEACVFYLVEVLPTTPDGR